MPEFTPRFLTSADVRKVFNDHLAAVEVNQIREHIALLQRELAPTGELELSESHELVERLIAERERLAKLARRKR